MCYTGITVSEQKLSKSALLFYKPLSNLEILGTLHLLSIPLYFQLYYS